MPKIVDTSPDGHRREIDAPAAFAPLDVAVPKLQRQ
jgi:hypothetical protein